MSNDITKIAEAKKAWQDGEYTQAIEILEQENELKQDDQVVSVLIHFYVTNQQFKEALQLIDDQAEDFVEKFELFEEYFSALIQTNFFIVARKELFNQKTLSEQRRRTYLIQLEEAEKLYAENFPQTITEIERDFYHIGDKKMRQQSRVVERAYHLPFENFKRAATFNLIDPFLNQLTRVSILKDLALIEMDEEVQFIWIDSKKVKVIPKQIQVNQMWEKIERLIENESDPVQGEMLFQQAKIFYDLAYPLPMQIFDTAEGWLDALKEQLNEQKMVPQFDKLNQIMLTLFEG